MFRNLMGNYGTVDAQYKAGVDMKKGMFAKKVSASKTAVLPTADGNENYLVDRPLGTTSQLTTLSDYEAIHNDIKTGEYVGLITLLKGQRWATDQFTGAISTFIVDNYVKIGTDGKLVYSATATNLKCLGAYLDNGKSLVAFEVLA